MDESKPESLNCTSATTKGSSAVYRGTSDATDCGGWVAPNSYRRRRISDL